MIELGSKARELAVNFPMGSPERMALEAHALMAEAWTVEHKRPVKSFSPEIREALKNGGLFIYDLSGKSIAGLKKEGYPLWINDLLKTTSALALPSKLTQVAFYPDSERFFLKGSFGKNEDQQDKLFAEYAKEFEKQFPGTRLIKGEGPDYTELSSKHSQDPEERLFGEKYGYCWTRTSTPVAFGRLAVGFFDDDRLRVDSFGPDVAFGLFGVVPLVVPA